MTYVHRSPDVQCAGCGELTPYAVGGQPGDGSFGEYLHTPLGDCFHRTHWQRSCVRKSRARVQGTPFVPGPSDEDRKRQQLTLGETGQR